MKSKKSSGYVVIILSVIFWLTASVALPGYRVLRGPGKENWLGIAGAIATIIALIGMSVGVYLIKKKKTNL